MDLDRSVSPMGKSLFEIRVVGIDFHVGILFDKIDFSEFTSLLGYLFQKPFFL